MGRKDPIRYTTIQLLRETKKALDHLGFKGETYDDIIQRAILGKDTSN
jgi:hypothetical protein